MQTGGFTQADALPSVRQSLTLLIGQSIFFGIGLSLWYVAANTLFLIDWGAARLPWVFIGVAIFVSVFSYGLTELQRRWSPARVVIFIGLTLTTFCLLARLSLSTALARPASLVLLVGCFLGFQMEFVSLGAQAGQVLDIRQMKRFFPIILAGSSLGYVVGGLSTPFLVRLLNGTSNLLYVASASLLIMLLLLFVTVVRLRTALDQPVAKNNDVKQSRSFLQLLRQRYIARTFAYQLLSAIGTLLMLFMLTRQAETMFPAATDLAQFFGMFSAARNLLIILFSSFLAGRLLDRFGLRFGLTANPAGVGGLVIMMVMAAWMADKTLLFWLATGGVGLDVILSECITLPSLKTIYQALPAHDRQRTEMTVEGIGVPLAYGIGGGILLLLNAIPGLRFTHLILFTLLMIMPWLASGLLLYHDYAGMLLRTLSRHALGAAQLERLDHSSLQVVEKLLHSPKLGDIHLALNMLEQDDHALLSTSLIALLDRNDAAVRAEALARIARLQITAARAAVMQRLAVEADPEVKGAALQAFCALSGVEVVEQVKRYLDDADLEVRLGALVGLLRHGGIPGILAAGQQLMALEKATGAAERAFVARVIGAVGIDSFYQPLWPLLADADLQVRRAALLAASQVAHPRLLPAIIANLAQTVTRSAAANALIASGELVLPVMEKALGDAAEWDEETIRRLVRICGQIKGERMVALLKQHLDYPDSELHQQILQSLHLCGYRAADAERPPIMQALHNCARHGLRLLLAQQEIAATQAAAPLHAALHAEMAQVRMRLMLLLSFLYNAQALLQVEERLARGQNSAKALALETLDVMLASDEKALVLPLVNESMSLAQRINALDRHFSLPRLEGAARLGEIIADTSLWTQSWTRACAIYTAGKLAVATLADAIEHTLALDKHPVRETAIWALAALGSGNGSGSSTEATRRTQVASADNQPFVTSALVGRVNDAIPDTN